ncbi:MAG: glycosyltransferase [Flavobacteriales bacterium]|nr:glycosyltransferase [Flavobacteriales bacterium]
MSGKVRVLIAVDWYTPAFRAGGPIRSVANAVAELGDQFELWVVSSTYDMGSGATHDVDNPIVASNRSWTQLGQAHVLYLDRTRWSATQWTLIFEEVKADVLYLNSMFSRPFSRLPMGVARKWRSKSGSNMRIVLAPRGMLDPGALAVKPLKKYAFLSFARALGRFNGIRWQAASDREAESIRQHFPAAEIVTAPNIARTAPKLEGKTRVHPPERYITVGRIHRIKNQAFAAAVLASRAAEIDDAVVYQLIGPVEDEQYLSEIESCGSFANGKGLKIEILGAITPDEIPALLCGARAMLAPSLNENFGHAIAESLGQALPVLVSDQTPWTQSKLGKAGLCLALNADLWAEALAAFSVAETWAEAERDAQSNFNSAHSDPEILAAYRKLWAL